MILLGKIVTEKIYENLKIRIKKLNEEGIKPALAVVLIGEDPASLTYIKIKKKRAEELGIIFKLFHLGENASEEAVIELVKRLNQNPDIHGIVLQLPLSKNINTEKIIALISQAKDIDGLNEGYPSPTAAAILEIFNYYAIDLIDKNIVLVGHGKLVGQPLGKMIRAQNIMPVICDSKTENLKEITAKADILISATGVPGIIKSDWVKDGTVIVDAGTAESNGKMVGDVDPGVYAKNVSYTPTPGGVGPMTVAILLNNLITACEKK